MIAFAVLFLWMSLGVNVYHFCCSACADYGADVFLLTSCEEIHAAHVCTDDGCACRASADAGMPSARAAYDVGGGGCGVEHYSIDIQNIVNIQYHFSAPVCTVPEMMSLLSPALPERHRVARLFCDMPPSSLSGRDLLSRVSTLLI